MRLFFYMIFNISSLVPILFSLRLNIISYNTTNMYPMDTFFLFQQIMSNKNNTIRAFLSIYLLRGMHLRPHPRTFKISSACGRSKNLVSSAFTRTLSLPSVSVPTMVVGMPFSSRAVTRPSPLSVAIKRAPPDIS